MGGSAIIGTATSLGGAQNVVSEANLDETANVGGAKNVGGTRKDLIQVKEAFIVAIQDCVRVIFRAP